MSFAQSLDALAQAANETKVQEPPKKRRKHVHAASSHNRPDNELATDVSALSRSRSQSPSASSPPLPHAQDHRVFQETLNDSLHARSEKRIGKFITDDRFDRLVRACGLPLKKRWLKRWRINITRKHQGYQHMTFVNT